MGGLLLAFLPASLAAQSNICQASAPSVPTEARIELARIQAEERSRQEMTRAGWTAAILPVKNLISTDSLKALCIFGIEVVPQAAQRLVAVRAPKEMMPAIEEALKRLDVPPAAARSVEITAYVLVVSEVTDPSLMPLPAVLQPVANQLRSILPNGTLFLADTVVTRTAAGAPINTQGVTTLIANVSLSDGTPPVVKLAGMNAVYATQGGRVSFSTSVDVPVGTQVVVGKSTVFGKPAQPVVLVISAKVID
jgi:hypothetical protein